MARVLSILALLALLVQFSPLRACAWQFVLSGESCHDLPGAAEHRDLPKPPVTVDGCAPHNSSSHDDTCLCERPASSADRAVNHQPPIDAPALLSTACVPPSTDLFVARWTEIPLNDLSPAPSVGRLLPLLL